MALWRTTQGISPRLWRLPMVWYPRLYRTESGGRGFYCRTRGPPADSGCRENASLPLNSILGHPSERTLVGAHFRPPHVKLLTMLPDARWTPWIPLLNSWRGDVLPAIGGLYRIRRIGGASLDYLGQTGTGTMTLRKRLAMLKGVYAPVMPYCDPHVAAPGLWALLRLYGVPFEVSTMPMPKVGVVERKTREALEISLHRQEFGSSPTINFGRMPPGFTRSSHNNVKLQRAGKVQRGGHSDSDPREYHAPGIIPCGVLDVDCLGDAWCGIIWSPWVLPNKQLILSLGMQTGLYRLRRTTSGGLIYIGQGIVRDRLKAHQSKGLVPEHAQFSMFRDPTSILVSWALNPEWLDHHRLELENDLISAHFIAFGCPPIAQFRG